MKPILHQPARILRPVEVPGATLPPGTPVLASRWGGQLWVLWHGVEVPVHPGAVQRVETITKEAA